MKSFVISSFFIGSLILAQTGLKSEPCESPVIKKAQIEGFRSLKLNEVLHYYLDLRKCKDRKIAKSIQYQVSQNQLILDAEQSRLMQGFTSGFAYLSVVYLIYLALN